MEIICLIKLTLSIKRYLKKTSLGVQVSNFRLQTNVLYSIIKAVYLRTEVGAIMQK